MSVMGVGLQREIIARKLEARGVPADTVDVSALVDETLHLPENVRAVEAHLGLSLSGGVEDEAYWEKAGLMWADRVTENGAVFMGEVDGEKGADRTEASGGDQVGASPPVVHVAGGASSAPLASQPGASSQSSASLDAALRALRFDASLREHLERIVAWEEQNAKRSIVPDLGWEPGEVPVPGHVVKKLLSVPLVRLSYSSRRYTQYLLLDRAGVRAALLQASQGYVPPPVDVAAVDVERFERVACSGDAVHALLSYVAPHVHGLEDAKRAVLLMLASPDDEGASRARVHVLLHGPPGTAKTELLMWAAKVARVEVFSPRMTGPGLTVDLRSGQPGALPQAHESEFRVVVVDEVEKCAPQALRQTLQALEEGEFSFVSANGKGTFKAEVKFVGAANVIADLPPEFVDRMDFCVQVPLPTRDGAKQIVRSVMDSWMRPSSQRSEDFIRGYLRWVRSFEPGFSDAERELASRVVSMLVDFQEKEEVRVRPLLAINRVAYVIARLERRDVTAELFVRAVEILYPEMNGGKRAALRQIVEAARRRSVNGGV